MITMDRRLLIALVVVASFALGALSMLVARPLTATAATNAPQTVSPTNFSSYAAKVVSTHDDIALIEDVDGIRRVAWNPYPAVVSGNYVSAVHGGDIDSIIGRRKGY